MKSFLLFKQCVALLASIIAEAGPEVESLLDAMVSVFDHDALFYLAKPKDNKIPEVTTVEPPFAVLPVFIFPSM